jgi:hypothetical protein
MGGRKTTMLRVDREFAERLAWLARHERAVAEKAGRKPRTVARILSDLAGKRVDAAFEKIEPWVKTVRAALEPEAAKKG